MTVCLKHNNHFDETLGTCLYCRYDAVPPKLVAPQETTPLRLDMSMRPSKEDLDKAERKRRRNDLATEAMVAIIEKSPFVVSINDHEDWVFKAVADGAYAYADAMLAASGDYDDN
jgi:hypothetical protein